MDGRRALVRQPRPTDPAVNTERLRVGPFREGSFSSPLHDERLAAYLGTALGVAFTLCFATGMLSHAAQHPPSWFTMPSRPVNLYRVTQGIHVMAGIASIPLLLAKLWVVYPRLWEWPVVKSATHAVERIGIVVLIGASFFQLSTGVVNIAYWYGAMPFDFLAAHFWTSWIVVGGLVMHIGAKTGTIGDAYTVPAPPIPGAVSRRGFLGATMAAAGALTLTVIGETVAPLRRLAVLAPRRIGVGTQDVPVNKSAAQTGVTEAATDAGYRLVVEGKVERTLRLSIDDLRALPRREAGLPISCVEGWSVAASWAGPRIRDLLDAAGAQSGASVRVESLQKGGRYRTSLIEGPQVADHDCLLALELNGEALSLDHGYPARLIAPARPGVLQTKWVHKVVVL